MGFSYSMDLREKVVAAYDNREGSMEKLAVRFRVSQGFVRNLLNRRRTAGTLRPKSYKGGKKSQLETRHLDWIQALYTREENMEHQVACDRLEQAFGIKIGSRWMSKVVKRLGFSRKKKAFRILPETKKGGPSK